MANGIITWLNHHQYAVNFRFDTNKTPFSLWYVPFCTVICYFVVLWLLRMYMKHVRNDVPYNLSKAIAVHSGLLSLASLIVCVLMGVELCRMFVMYGFWDVFCDHESRHTYGTLYLLYYVNYIFKFWELLDTVFLVLKCKSLEPMHVYHHAATLVLTWTQMRAESCMQWVVIILNLIVHVVMYYYYHLAARKISVWWKKYLTQLQIVQFVLDLVACVTALGSRMLYLSGFTQFYRCHGDNFWAFFGIGVLFSYLILFAAFYGRTYKKRAHKQKSS